MEDRRAPGGQYVPHGAHDDTHATQARPDEPAKYDYHFKLMCTVGEPIEPEVWRWYHEAVGKREAVIVDTWWMTETGGFPRVAPCLR